MYFCLDETITIFNVQTIKLKHLFVMLFQTEDFLEIQLVDFSSVFSNPPNCLSSNPSILASFLRGVGILLTAPQHEDDGEIYEEQIVFQPANCQENLRILEALLAVLVKGTFCSFVCLLIHGLMKLKKKIAIVLFCLIETNVSGAMNQSEGKWATTFKSTSKAPSSPRCCHSDTEGN